jgi:hypothetical protein
MAAKKRRRGHKGTYWRVQLDFADAMVEGHGNAEAAARAHARNLASRHGLDPDAATETATEIYGRLPRELRPGPP